MRSNQWRCQPEAKQFKDLTTPFDFIILKFDLVAFYAISRFRHILLIDKKAFNKSYYMQGKLI